MKIRGVDVLLSIQRALVGEVFPSLDTVWIRIKPSGVDVTWGVDGAVSEEDSNSVSCVEAEMQADFDEKFDIQSTILPVAEARRRVRETPDKSNLVCVFSRRPPL